MPVAPPVVNQQGHGPEDAARLFQGVQEISNSINYVQRDNVRSNVPTKSVEFKMFTKICNNNISFHGLCANDFTLHFVTLYQTINKQLHRVLFIHHSVYMTYHIGLLV